MGQLRYSILNPRVEDDLRKGCLLCSIGQRSMRELMAEIDRRLPTRQYSYCIEEGDDSVYLKFVQNYCGNVFDVSEEATVGGNRGIVLLNEHKVYKIAPKDGRLYRLHVLVGDTYLSSGVVRVKDIKGLQMVHPISDDYLIRVL